MRIFLAGASGVVGRPLVPRLIAEGHRVSAMTRRPENVDAIEAAGADPVVCDVFDADRLRAVVVAARPDVVIQHLTDLPQEFRPRGIKQAYARNNRVRGEGSAKLVAAAQAAGVKRYIAQNVCFMYAPTGPWVVDEDHPLATGAPDPFGSMVQLHIDMERRIVENPAFRGIVLRFGFWYGPATTFAADGHTAREVRRRRYPIIGDGAGVQSFIHMDDVVDATIAALTRGSAGVYNVCDDDPAPMRDWLPAYAEAVGARPPMHVPAWLARLAVGGFLVGQATRMRGASNERFKREFDWKPQVASWREGFRTALG
jgi:nucleoside-diphosphate-sugar epimerase